MLAPTHAFAIRPKSMIANRRNRSRSTTIENSTRFAPSSSRRNRPIRMFTVFKNRGSTPYTTILRFFKRPEAQLSPAWSPFVTPVLPNPPQFRAKPAQPNAALLGDPVDPINYFNYGPITIAPGTTKIAWTFTLPNCAGPQTFNVTINPADIATIPQSCWGQRFGVRVCGVVD